MKRLLGLALLGALTACGTTSTPTPAQQAKYDHCIDTAVTPNMLQGCNIYLHN